MRQSGNRTSHWLHVRYLVLFIVVAGIRENGIAKTKLAMEAAVREAIVHNVSLRSILYEHDAAQADKTTASLRPNPNLLLQADIIPTEGIKAIDKSYGGSFGMPFELGGKRSARMSMAGEFLKLTDLQIESVEHLLTENVRNAYIDCLSTRQKLSVLQKNLALLDSLVSLSSIRVKDQEIAAVELTRAELERSKFLLGVYAAEQDYRAACTGLLMLLGRTMPEIAVQFDSIEFDEFRNSDTAASAIGLDSLFVIGKESRSDLRAARQNEEVNKANLELQRSQAAIDLNVSLDLFRQQSITYTGASFSLPVKLFDRNQGEIEKAEVRLQQSNEQTKAAELQFFADLLTVWHDANSKRGMLKTLNESVVSRSEDVRATVEYSYLHGGTSLLDLLDALRTQNEITLNYIDALTSYKKSLITLNFIIGKDIFNVQ
jgi:cobalt-zinc-cadmium efflux system outer membrane protein